MTLLMENVGGKLKSKTTRGLEELVLEPFEVENKLEACVAGLSRKDWRSLRNTIRSECSAVRDQGKPRQKGDCTLWNEAIDWRYN